ncbi:MAG: dihydroorotase [Deltaproteobacteria bacterium]|jgi:dihydroorotase|nr:dihydroorotase [Deltaproteobacteria bacterium]
MNNCLIKGGRVIDPARQLDAVADIWVEGGRIKAVEPNLELLDSPPPISAQGLWILPGLIDMHVHLREPGHEYKEDLQSGLTAAVAGGFTTVLAMPNTSPPLDEAGLIAGLAHQAQQIRGARLSLAAAMTRGRQGQELCEYQDLKAAGAQAVTDDGSWVADSRVMRRVLDYAAVCGLLPLSHAQDPWLARGDISEGRVSTRLGLPGIPAQCEEIAVFRDIALAELTGQPLHICHLSTRQATRLVRAARAKGLPVTAETAPHYLFLTDEDVGDYNTAAKMNPPLGSDLDQAALREALLDGTISVIASDHAPHSTLEKELEFGDAAFGIIGLETSLPLMLELARIIDLPIARLVELMSKNPAKLLNLPGGSLAPGGPADITIVDPNLEFTYEAQQGFSKSHNTPFDGRKFQGRAVITIVGGEIRYRYPRLSQN